MVASETMGYNMMAANAGVRPDDYTAIATTAGLQMGIVASSAKGWTSFADLVAAANAGETVRMGVMTPKLADLAYWVGKAQGVDLNIISVQGGKAVMNGVNAGDMDAGFMAGIQAKGVAAGDLVNLASALSVPLTQTPDAPTLGDLGVPFDADGYFLIIGPDDMPAEARDALNAAINDVISTDGTKSNAMITKAFGGPAVMSADEAQAMMETQFVSAGELMKAASE